MQRTALSVALYACLFDAASAQAVQLLPAGEFAARDGRPGPGRKWRLSDVDGRRLAERLNARQTPMVFDYEHQTLAAEANGQPAPAAGWASKFEWRDGSGLFALGVDWTQRAAAHIEAREYKYISPVIVSRKSDDVVVDVLHAALVNFPAVDGMDAITARFAAAYDAAQSTQENDMDLLQKIVAALKLAKETTEDKAVEAIAALATRCAAAETEVTALKAAGGTADEAVKALQREVAELRTAAARREQDEVIEAALKAGKLLPALESWARTLSIDALRAYVKDAPAIAALGGSQTGGKGADGRPGDVAALKQKAAEYIKSQAALGIAVTADQAVRHVQQAA